MRLLKLLTIAVFLLPISFAHAEKVNNIDRFALWNGCRPIGLLVTYNNEYTETSPQKKDIEIAVRSRLRGARLYTEKDTDIEGSPLPYLAINIIILDRIILGKVFSIDLFLNKWVSDPISNVEFFASTWHIGIVNVGYRDDILSAIAQYTDRFIDEYLRVNEAACRP